MAAGALTWPSDGPPEGTKERVLWRAQLVIDLVGDESEEPSTRLLDVLTDLAQWCEENDEAFIFVCHEADHSAAMERNDWPPAEIKET